MKTPDEKVTENIVAEFTKRGLLSQAILEKLKPKLQAGALTSADWKLAFEADRKKDHEPK